MKWGLKGGISIDADSGPPRYVLWCCGGIWHWPYCARGGQNWVKFCPHSFWMTPFITTLNPLGWKASNILFSIWTPVWLVWFVFDHTNFQGIQIDSQWVVTLPWDAFLSLRKEVNPMWDFNPIPTGCCHVTLIFGLIPPNAGRNRVKWKEREETCYGKLELQGKLGSKKKSTKW